MMASSIKTNYHFKSIQLDEFRRLSANPNCKPFMSVDATYANGVKERFRFIKPTTSMDVLKQRDKEIVKETCLPDIKPHIPPLANSELQSDSLIKKTASSPTANLKSLINFLLANREEVGAKGRNVERPDWKCQVIDSFEYRRLNAKSACKVLVSFDVTYESGVVEHVKVVKHMNSSTEAHHCLGFATIARNRKHPPYIVRCTRFLQCRNFT